MNKLSVFSLILLITGAIDSIRNLPAAALFGSSLIFFFILSAVVFLIPTALVSAELSAKVDGGGIYQWVRAAFGNRIGFLAVWLQWINNVIWFPTILSFIAGTVAYLINPALAENKAYLVSVILFLFWGLTLLNLYGIRVSAKFTSFCALIGLLFPMALIITLFLVWLASGHPLQFHITSSNFFPDWWHTDNWLALTAIMLSFCGMELATVHVKDVNQPQKSFPKALAISTVIILITMMMGSLAIAMVLPYKQINLVNGTIQTFSYFLSAYHLSWLTPILTLLLVIGSIGGMISWVISPVKGLSQAAQQGFLPAFLQQENRQGVPGNLLIVQAVLVSLVCLVFLLFPSANGSYWFLSALSTQVYILMYVLMFLAALRLCKVRPQSKELFTIPGKQFGTWIVCIIGLLGCGLALAVGFIPPGQVNIGSSLYYELLFLGGMAAMVLPVFFFFRYQAKARIRQQAVDGVSPLPIGVYSE